MLTTIITLLIYICILALVIYLIIHVLQVIGVPIPPKVVQILWLILALVVILWVVQALLGGGGLRVPMLR